MRTLILTNLYPSSLAPTRGMFNLNGFRALSRYSEVRVVVPVRWWSRLRRPGEWFRVPHEEITGIPADLPTYWPVPRLHRSHVPTMIRALRPLLADLRDEFPFDTMLVAMAYSEGVVAAHLAEELQCPLVTMVLGSDVNELARRPALQPVIQWALRRSGRVLAVSQALGQRVRELGVSPDRIVVQHNGVDGERFQIRSRSLAREHLGLSQDRRLMVSVGNLVLEKGTDVLVEAMHRILWQGPTDVDLALVGDGALAPQLRSRVRALGMEDRVRFVGRRPNDEIAEWMAASDVFCLPSRREGCPNVALEALASGRPVVASRVGGVPELLNGTNGILVPPGEPDALASALRQALMLRWEPEALRETVPCLSWDEFGKAIYSSLESARREFVIPAPTARSVTATRAPV